MTYEAFELGKDTGAPVEYYEFIMTPLSWRYTNNFETMVYSAQDYVPANISRSSIAQTEEINRAALTITVPRDFAPADRFRVTPSSEPMFLNVYRRHLGDSQVVPVWQGRVMAVKWKSSTAELTCESNIAYSRRSGVTKTFSAICTHVHYGPLCRVVAEQYKDSPSLNTVNGTVLTSTDFLLQPNNWYRGGYIEYATSEGLIEQRTVISHIGNTVILANSPVGLEGDAEIFIYPGCNHTLSHCGPKFNNSPNYGGFPFRPKQSPFGGKTIF